MPRQTVAVEKEVIRWARESLRLTESKAASAIGIDVATLKEWESGEGGPTVGQLRKMSRAYKRPVTALMQPDVPPGLPAPKDYRTVGGLAPRLTPDALIAIRDAQRIQMLMTELVEDAPDIMPPVQIAYHTTKDSPSESALIDRPTFGISYNEQTHLGDINRAYNAWRARLQFAGIVVLAKSMSPMDCRGFSLSEGGHPVIVVNRAEVDQAKIFTLFHEYAHLTLRQGAICQERDAEPSERWCNRFAASLLVPEEWLRWNVPRDVTKTKEVEQLAKKFRVSRHVIALRLRELQLGDPTLYAQIKAEDDARAFVRPQATQPEDEKEEREGPSQAQKRLTEVGVAYAGAVLGALDRGLIDVVEATDYLNIAPGSIEPLMQRVKETAERYGG